MRAIYHARASPRRSGHGRCRGAVSTARGGRGTYCATGAGEQATVRDAAGQVRRGSARILVWASCSAVQAPGTRSSPLRGRRRDSTSRTPRAPRTRHTTPRFASTRTRIRARRTSTAAATARRARSASPASMKSDCAKGACVSFVCASPPPARTPSATTRRPTSTAAAPTAPPARRQEVHAAIPTAPARACVADVRQPSSGRAAACAGARVEFAALEVLAVPVVGGRAEAQDGAERRGGREARP